MTSSLDNTTATGDRSRARAYYRDFVPGMVAYVLLLSAVVRWGHLDGSSPYRLGWALLPVLPALWTVRAVLRHLRRVDEYQRGLLLESLAVGFGVAMVAAVTTGLAIAGLSSPLIPWTVYAAGMTGWAAAAALLSRR